MRLGRVDVVVVDVDCVSREWFGLEVLLPMTAVHNGVSIMRKDELFCSTSVRVTDQATDRVLAFEAIDDRGGAVLENGGDTLNGSGEAQLADVTIGRR